MAQQVPTTGPDVQVGCMVCPNCGALDPYPPTVSDDGTTTCPKCGHRFPVTDVPVPAPR
jgi:hypothetical protein